MSISYSVIMVCLNSGNTIRKAVDSIILQNPVPEEILFVDGGSTDDTLAIIESYKNKISDVRIRLLHQVEKTGISGAWNLAIPEIRSDLVFILNSDDWYESDAAKIVETEVLRNPDAEIYYGSSFWHHIDGKITVRTPSNFLLFPFLMPVQHPACFVKRAVYEKVGLFDPQYKISADYDFIYRCYRAGVRFHDVRKSGHHLPVVHMMLGGTANSNRVLARRETYEIGRKHCRIPLLPMAAYLFRKWTGR